MSRVNRKTNKLLLIAVVLVLAVVFAATTMALLERLTSNNDSGQIVYETEVDSAEDCTKLETYDPERGVCYFSCTGEDECASIQAEIDKELEGYAAALQEPGDKHSEEDRGNQEFSARYKVTAGEVISPISGDDKPEYRAMWQEVAKLSPDLISNEYIEEFGLYSDEQDDTLAFVADEDRNGKWQFGINVVAHKQGTAKEQAATIIHELGHIITLNTSQVDPQTEGCKNYLTDEGCARKDSYLNIFVERFWKSLDSPKYDEAQFVTEYATTNPEEDMAESFAFFVISPAKSAVSVRDQKVSFYEQFSELRDIRSSMRSSLSQDIIRARKQSN